MDIAGNKSSIQLLNAGLCSTGLAFIGRGTRCEETMCLEIVIYCIGVAPST